MGEVVRAVGVVSAFRGAGVGVGGVRAMVPGGFVCCFLERFSCSIM